MKLSFDVKNDFESTYYLPGYDCKVCIKVVDGIVELNIEDDFLEDYDDEDDYCDDLDCEYNVNGYCTAEDSEDVTDFYSDEDTYTSSDSKMNLKEEDDKLDFSIYSSLNDDEFNKLVNGVCASAVEGIENDSRISVEEDEKNGSAVPIEMSNEEKFVRKLAKVDKDGTIMNLLTNLLKNGKVSDLNSKVGKTFAKIINNLADIINEED